jgi:16S rRNA (guanine1207-N2)-methyltransferase
VDYDVAATIIEDARRLLSPGGRLVLVANRFIRYDRLMAKLFKRVHVLAENRRFHVLAAM